VSQVYELVKNPKYNIFAGMTWEQYKDIRDSITEMVLATDMGIHAKITQQFKNRLSEVRAWQSKEDMRLALSIALKMADISNCCRSTSIYQKWARCIVEEFYVQGDAEARLGYPISPFMDRNKDDTDFVKGQISFMNYIVVPLFNAGAELLPNMAFAADMCHRNREMLDSPNFAHYWKNGKDGATGT
jgi:hypothetical protein